MKHPRLLYTTLLVLVLLPFNLYAQIGRSEWSYGTVLQTDNLVYSTVGTLIPALPLFIVAASDDDDKIDSTINFLEQNKWWIPTFRYRANIIQKMEFAGKKATLYPRKWGFSGWDWELNNYSIGYHVGYLSRLYPIGFDVQADYIQDGYGIEYEGSNDKYTIIKRMISATALLKIRLLKYDSNRINPVIELGSSYNYAFHYHDNFINDKNAVNNGFTGIIGLGFTNTETHLSWSLRYEHSFYNFYNKSYHYNDDPIFADSKSKFGRLGVAMSIGF